VGPVHVDVIGWRNFEQFLAEPEMAQSLGHTLIYAVVTSGAKVLLAAAGRAADGQDPGPRPAPLDHLLPGALQHDRHRHHVHRPHEPNVGLINGVLAAMGITDPAG
jgi:hypothetical protein